MWGDDPVSSPSILCPPQVSSTPSTAAGGRATTGWCTETSATTARSPSRSGGVATSRSAPSLRKSPHEVPTSPLGRHLGMSWGHTSAGITSNVRLPPPQVGGRGVGCLQQVLRQAGGAGAGGAVCPAPAERHHPHPAHQILPRAAARDPPALRPPALPATVEDGSLVRGEFGRGEKAPQAAQRGWEEGDGG